jgi:hypothetical protein
MKLSPSALREYSTRWAIVGSVQHYQIAANLGRAELKLGNGAFWSLVAGGTLTAVTLAYGVVASKEPAKSGHRLQVLPAIAAHAGGLVVTGTW